MANPTAAPATAPATPQGPQTSVQAPKEGAAAGQATAAEIRKLKLKLDGQDVEMPESEVIALAQQAKGAGKRFQEAAELRRQAMEVMKAADDNPADFLTKKGKNVREWAENFLMEELKKEQMSPEQRKAAENETKLKKYEDERKAEEQKKKDDEMAALQAQHAENYNKLFVEALTKSGLPKTAYTVKRMAELQLVSIKKKLDLSADQLAKVVREDYMAEQKSLFGAYDGDQLLEFLGPELTKKLSRAQIAKLKAKGVRTSNTNTASRAERKQPLTWREYQLKNRGRG